HYFKDDLEELFIPCESLVSSEEAIGITLIKGASSSQGNLLQVDVQGKSAHASTPHLGVSAIHLLVSFLVEENLVAGDEKEFLRLLCALSGASDGSGVDLACADEEFGSLSLVAGVVSLKEDADEWDGAEQDVAKLGDVEADGTDSNAAEADGAGQPAGQNGESSNGPRRVITQTIDCRFPTTTTSGIITDTLKRFASKLNAVVEEGHCMEPFLLDPSSPVIRALLESYNEVTGEERRSFTMGGATYAREFKNAASFGPEKPWEKNPSWVGSMHGPDEGISEDSLKEAIKIYIITLEKLMHIPF
ncbi:MAG: M20/M25/M40 family metallo-hydrolase, partial [Anaerotardibacter sp.]